jgi:hypothetical protein
MLPSVATGGDPCGRTLWVWWLGFELVATLEHRKEANDAACEPQRGFDESRTGGPA